MISNRLARWPLAPKAMTFSSMSGMAKTPRAGAYPQRTYVCRIQINAQVQNLAQIIHVATKP